MNQEKQPEGTAAFIILLCLAISIAIMLFLHVNKQLAMEQQKHDTLSVASVAPSEGRVGEAPILPPAEQARLWEKRIGSLIQVNSVENSATNASYRLDACFIENGECSLYARGIRDEHEKVTFYFPSNYLATQESHAAFYISLKDGDLPRIIMRLVYIGDDWIAFRKVSVLVDQEKMLERFFSNDQIQSKSLGNDLVYELGDILVTDEMDFLNAVANANVDTLAIRMEGDSQNVDLEKYAFDNVILEAKDVLKMYQLISSTLDTTN